MKYYPLGTHTIRFSLNPYVSYRAAVYRCVQVDEESGMELGESYRLHFNYAAFDENDLLVRISGTVTQQNTQVIGPVLHASFNTIKVSCKTEKIDNGKVAIDLHLQSVGEAQELIIQ